MDYLSGKIRQHSNSHVTFFHNAVVSIETSLTVRFGPLFLELRQRITGIRFRNPEHCKFTSVGLHDRSFEIDCRHVVEVFIVP